MMKTARPVWARTAPAILAAVCLTGCISLFPKEKPAQMYRFGAEPSAAVTPWTGGGVFLVRSAPVGFDRAAASDRILTVEGDQTAFVAGGRWVTSATTLFEAAVMRAFEIHPGPARLLSFGEPGASDYILKLDVRTFEARYEHGLNEPPRVVIEVYAAMAPRKDARGGGARVFQATAPASSNSVHAITAAYDEAVRKVLGDIVAWVDARGVG